MSVQASGKTMGNKKKEGEGANSRLPLPWWQWWGRQDKNYVPPVPPPAASRWVLAVENGWHSETRDVPPFVQNFVMAMEAQEDADTVPTVEWWELFVDPEAQSTSEPFHRLLTDDSAPPDDAPAIQNVLVTLHEPEGKQQRDEPIAFFPVTGQGTRYFVGHVPGTHAWLWGCCLWAVG